MERTHVENVVYKELRDMNVGIDYVEWIDGSNGYIYFEERYGNHAEDYHATLDEAYEQLTEWVDYFGGYADDLK